MIVPGIGGPAGLEDLTFRREIVRKLDKRLDPDGWPPDGKVVASSVTIQEGRRRRRGRSDAGRGRLAVGRGPVRDRQGPVGVLWSGRDREVGDRPDAALPLRADAGIPDRLGN